MMGVPINYDDDVERKRTHALLRPKVEPVRMTVSVEQMLKDIGVLAPEAKKKKSPPKGILRGKANKSTSPRLKIRRNEVMCWPESKYGSVSGPQWKWNSRRTRFRHVACH